MLEKIDEMDGRFSLPSDEYQNPLAEFENTVEFFIRQKLVKHIPTVYLPKSLQDNDKDYFKTTELGKTALQSQRIYKVNDIKDAPTHPLLIKYEKLNAVGRKKVEAYLDDLIASGNYDDGNEICATVSTNKKSLA